MKVYLATPYTSPYDHVRRQRYAHVTNAAGLLIVAGHHVYSPITHNHPIAELHSLPHHFDFWEKLDRSFIEWAELVTVLTLDGWMTSRGVTAEIEIAREMGKPVVLWGYGEEIPVCLRQPEP